MIRVPCLGLLVSFDPATIALSITAIAATASTGVAIANYEAGQSAAKAQKDLADQQEAQLQQQQQEAAAQAAQAAITGQTFGWSDNPSGTAAAALGFGATPQTPNAGRASLTGF